MSYRYVWFEDGVEDAEVTGAEYPAERTAKGRTYSVDVYPSDDTHEGAPASAERTVDNSAPAVDAIAVTPDAAPIGTEVTCLATGTDADEDAITITYAWSDGSTGSTYRSRRHAGGHGPHLHGHPR